MSYIPKYILKRMVPKDAVKKVENGIEIHMVNVISPLSIDDGIPDDAENHVNFKVNGEDLSPELKKQITFTLEGGDSYSIENAKEFEGVVIPVGGKLVISAPVTNVEAGETHEFEVVIHTDNPFQVKIKREVQ